MNQTEQMLREALCLLQEIHPGNMTPMAEESWKAATVLIEQALSHVNETPKNEHDSDDVLKRAPLVRLTDGEIEQAMKAGQRTWAQSGDTLNGLNAAIGKAIMDAMQERNK